MPPPATTPQTGYPTLALPPGLNWHALQRELFAARIAVNHLAARLTKPHPERATGTAGRNVDNLAAFAAHAATEKVATGGGRTIAALAAHQPVPGWPPGDR